MELLTPSSLPAILRDTVFLRSLAAGQPLFQQGAVASTFFIVATGRIQLVRNTIDNQTVCRRTIEPGESLAEVALFASTYPDTAIATVATRVIAYPKHSLLAALREYPDLATDIMARMVKKIQTLQMSLELRDISAAHKRVLQYLRYLVDTGDNIVTFNRPMKDIATELGFTPETLSRALTKLEQEGAITRSGRSITLHDSSAA